MSECFERAKALYAAMGVDVEAAMARLDEIPVSLHCWQGDDVAGFENSGSLDGGLAVTGNYPGRARNAEELRADIAEVLKLIPGKKRLNLHAIYAETNGKVARNELETCHFSNWLDFAKEQNIGLDFNPTCFAHPLATNGTLTSADAGVRKFWIEHAIACRRIAADFGKELNNTCVTNIWIPDGAKDTPYDRLAPRQRLMDSLDAILAEKIEPKYNLDAVDDNIVRCPDASVASRMEELILDVKRQGDTVGGVVTCVVQGAPAGLGEPLYDKLSARLAQAMLSINAAKGFEYGNGFAAALGRGSLQNDIFYNDNGRISTKTNNSGGIQGGISNGQDIYFRVAFKPVATILMEQQTVTKSGDESVIAAKGRHDPCVVPRAVPVVEAMAALTILDFLRIQEGVAVSC